MKNLVASERSLNYHLRPVINYRGHVTFPYEHVDTNGERFVCTTSWSWQNSMIMDVIVSEALKTIFKRNNSDNFPKSISDKRVQQYLRAQNPTYFKKNTFSMTLPLQSLYNNYPHLRIYTYGQLTKLFQLTADCRFIFPYHYRIINLKLSENIENNIQYRTKYDKWEKQDEPESLFEFTLIDDKIKIDFETDISSLIINNIMSMSIDWIQTNLYGLNPLAQFIYRRFIIGKNAEQLEFDYFDILDVVTSNNTTLQKKSIFAAFDDLQKSSILNNWSFKKFGNKRKYLFLVLNKNHQIKKLSGDDDMFSELNKIKNN